MPAACNKLLVPHELYAAALFTSGITTELDATARDGQPTTRDDCSGVEQTWLFMGGFSGLGQFEEIRRVQLHKQKGKAVVTACHKARERETGKRQAKQLTGKARDSGQQATSFKFFWSQPFSVKQCQSAKSMFPAIVASWPRADLVTARLSRTTRNLLEPLLLDLTESAVRRATGVRGHRYASVSLRFPGLNIVRLNVTWSYNYWLAILLLICLDHFVWNKESGFVRWLIGSSQLVPRQSRDNPNM